MTSGQALLDNAAKVCGSRYALSKRLNVSQAQLSAIANGHEGVAPGLAARLAEIVGPEGTPLALKAMIEREKHAASREALQRLFKLAPAAALIGIASLLGAPSPAESSTLTTVCANQIGDGLYIMSTVLRRLLRALRHGVIINRTYAPAA